MNKLKNHFDYFWWAYLLFSLAVCLLWTSVFAQIAKPQKNEELNIIFFGESFEGERFQDDLCSLISGYTSQELKKIKVKTVAPDNNMLGQLVQIGVQSSDILIFEEDLFIQNYLNYFNQLSLEKLYSFFEGAELDIHTINDKPYGIVLKEGTVFGNYYNGENRCIAIFSPSSVNLSALYGIGDEKDDAAIQTIKFLLELADEKD